MDKIPLFKPFSASGAGAAYQAVLDSGFTGQGKVNAEFEAKLQEYFGCNYLATVNSATSAEALAELLLRKPYQSLHSYWPGLEPGDEFLTPSLTCLATQTPWFVNGRLAPKWVDIDPETLNLDLDDLSRKVTAKTKIIILVHWGGYAVDLDKVKSVQDKAEAAFGFRPAVVEDCAHAFGTRYKGKLLGNHGNICTFSLQSIKHIQAGDGGFITLPHADLFIRAKKLRWYGIDRETEKLALRCDGDVTEIGSKYHMNDLVSSLGLENLKYAAYILDKHRSNSAYYDKALKNISGITLLKREDHVESACWLYSFLVEDRANFIKALDNQGIMANQVHERTDKHSAFREYRTILPTLDKIMSKVVSIPVGYWVDEKTRERIVDVIKKGW